MTGPQSWSLPASDWSTFSWNCVELPGVHGVGRHYFLGNVVEAFENRGRKQIPATNVFSRSVEQSRGSYDVPPFPIRRSEKIAGES